MEESEMPRFVAGSIHRPYNGNRDHFAISISQRMAGTVHRDPVPGRPRGQHLALHGASFTLGTLLYDLSSSDLPE